MLGLGRHQPGIASRGREVMGEASDWRALDASLATCDRHPRGGGGAVSSR